MADPTPLPDDQAAASDAAPRPRVRPVDLRDYVDFSPEQARRVRVFATGRLALDLWCIQPQQATPALLYPEVDVTYTVMGGRSWFVTEDGEIGLDPLGSMLVPAGVAHGIDNRGADPLIITASSSPPGAEPEAAPVSDTSEAIRVDPGPGPVKRALRRLFGRG